MTGAECSEHDLRVNNISWSLRETYKHLLYEVGLSRHDARLIVFGAAMADPSLGSASVRRLA